MKVSIRRASKAEAEQLSGIALAAKKHWDYPEPWFELWSDMLKITPEFISNNNVWVATYNNQAVGFAAISMNETVAELEHMWVIPKYMGQGVGKNLMTKVMQYCIHAGMKSLRIESDPNARAFYEKMGARFTGYVESIPKPRKLPVLVIEL